MTTTIRSAPPQSSNTGRAWIGEGADGSPFCPLPQFNDVNERAAAL